jgi:hypothetical protein
MRLSTSYSLSTLMCTLGSDLCELGRGYLAPRVDVIAIKQTRGSGTNYHVRLQGRPVTHEGTDRPLVVRLLPSWAGGGAVFVGSDGAVCGDGTAAALGYVTSAIASYVVAAADESGGDSPSVTAA